MGRCTLILIENLCEKSSFLGNKNDMPCNQKSLLLPILLFLPGFQNTWSTCWCVQNLPTNYCLLVTQRPTTVHWDSTRVWPLENALDKRDVALNYCLTCKASIVIIIYCSTVTRNTNMQNLMNQFLREIKSFSFLKMSRDVEVMYMREHWDWKHNIVNIFSLFLYKLLLLSLIHIWRCRRS